MAPTGPAVVVSVESPESNVFVWEFDRPVVSIIDAQGLTVNDDANAPDLWVLEDGKVRCSYLDSNPPGVVWALVSGAVSLVFDPPSLPLEDASGITT